MTTVTKDQVIKLHGNKTLSENEMWKDRLNILINQVIDGDLIVNHIDDNSFSYTKIEKPVVYSEKNYSNS